MYDCNMRFCLDRLCITHYQPILSRREVVAQAFGYVSDLSRLTVDELDGLVDGSLGQVLTDFQSGSDLWKACGVNLRAGIIKVVIAVDEANEDLIRIVRYINEHSDLDVRLVSISKYDDGKILIPNIVVSGSNDVIHRNKTKERFIQPKKSRGTSGSFQPLMQIVKL